MPSWAWYAAPALYLVHALAMIVDEAWYHRRRGLGRWERWGHPADTLTVLVCYLLALAAPAAAGPGFSAGFNGLPAGLGLYLAAAAFSTLFVTKDEWIHAGACTGGEMWLHAFLFALHPVLLFLAGLHGWSAPEPASGGAPGLASTGGGRGFFGAFLAGQAMVTGMFLLWQISYWNGPWARSIPATR